MAGAEAGLGWVSPLLDKDWWRVRVPADEALLDCIEQVGQFGPGTKAQNEVLLKCDRLHLRT